MNPSTRRIVASILVPIGLCSGTGPARAEEPAFVTVRILSAELANRIAVVAEQECKKRGFQVSAAVTDRFGKLLAFARDPLSGAHTIQVSRDKAYTAATFQGATLELAERLEGSPLGMRPGIALIGGGVPVRIGGFIYGAVGVSGAPAEKRQGDVDDACARAGIDA
ncbi:MAG: heme-binding protein, partial [Gammaproteobacteria bacterium]|nr:heme-binding protein [Gammaproteobacteria bacterium]